MGLSGVSGKKYANRGSSGFAAAVLTLLTLHSAASFGSIASEPLATSSGAPPNIFFILDDSGSMKREQMPDRIRPKKNRWGGYQRGHDFDRIYENRYGQKFGTNAKYKWYWSSKVNTIYFDPDAAKEGAYEPPLKVDGSGQLPDQDYTNARKNGYDPGTGDDLRDDFAHSTHQSIEGGAFYYKFDETKSGCDSESNKGIKDNQCYNYVSVNDADADLKQAFANWYSYYRKRQYVARAGISKAFDKQLNETSRLGWAKLPNARRGSDYTKVKGVRPYGDYQGDFREWLYSKGASGGTPLRQALYDIGSYYETDEPWLSDPVNGGGSQRDMASCRQSFTILMTDGVRNGDLHDGGEVGNVDASPGPFITGTGDGQSYQYEPRPPFEDEFGNRDPTLADVAMHFWKRDIKDGIANEVPLPKVEKGRDKPFSPAFWQHMVSMTIGFGVSGNVSRDDARDAVYDGTEVDFADPGTATGKIDDLLHAAINSRGDYVSAQDTNQFVDGLGRLLAQAQAGGGSSSAAAVSAAVKGPDSKSFTAKYDGSNWTGSLVAKKVDSADDDVWKAKNQLQAMKGNRNLYTSKNGNGVELAFKKLSEKQKGALNTNLDGSESDQLGKDRVTWLRGDQTVNEDFRNVTENLEGGYLGDIVNSDPQIERKVNFGHTAFDSSYGGYRGKSVYLERPDVIYVGANDGFLHAFDAETGEELFGYMPSSLLQPVSGDGYAPVNELMDPEYEHRFFVDGTPTLMDAKIEQNGSKKWRTVVVGTMGVGGDQVFALDVTEPQAFDIKEDLLWEFSHKDLERGVQKAQVGRLANGEWAAIFGSGHGASAGYLFVVNLNTGELIKKFEAGGSGLSTPAFTVDKGILEYVYAGNMDGELWRFDLSASKKKKWDATKLFQAKGPKPDEANQPITSAPVIADMPKTEGERVISFGTGSFFRNGDDADTRVQSLYGIIDENGSSKGIQRKDLLVQEIEEDSEIEDVDVEQDDGSTEEKDFTVRKVSEKKLSDSDDGWVMDLDTVSGERVVSQPGFPSGLDRSRVRFSTLIPDSDICSSGTDGFLMEISLITGGRVHEPVLDLDRDGKGDHEDQSGIKGVLGGEGITRMRDEDGDIIIGEDGGEAGRLKVPEGSLGRRNWEQLQ